MLIAFSAPETGLVHTVRYYSPKVTAAFRTIIIVVQCVCVCVHCDTHSICCITCMQMCTYTHTHTQSTKTCTLLFIVASYAALYIEHLDWIRTKNTVRHEAKLWTCYSWAIPRRSGMLCVYVWMRVCILAVVLWHLVRDGHVESAHTFDALRETRARGQVQARHNCRARK